MIFLAARGEVYGSLAVCFLFGGVGHDHRRQAGLPGDLDRRGDVQAQQALPVRHLDDDEQQPGVPAARGSSAGSSSTSPTTSGRAGRRASSRTSAPRSRAWCRWCCSSATAAGRRRSPRSSCCASTSASCRSIPMGVPLEWNVFMMFSVLALFVGHAGVGLGDLHEPVADRAVRRRRGHRGRWETCSRARSPSCPACATTPATGTPRCGASSRRPTQKIAEGIVAIASMPAAQMEKFYGSKETAEMYQYMGYAFRALQHPRPRDVHARASRDGRPRRGRLRADRRRADLQHRHRLELRRRAHAQRAADRRPAAAVPTSSPARCGCCCSTRSRFTSSARSTGWSMPRRASSSGAIVHVADMVTRQPWDDTVPVHVTWSEGRRRRA